MDKIRRVGEDIAESLDSHDVVGVKNKFPAGGNRSASKSGAFNSFTRLSHLGTSVFRNCL